MSVSLLPHSSSTPFSNRPHLALVLSSSSPSTAVPSLLSLRSAHRVLMLRRRKTPVRPSAAVDDPPVPPSPGANVDYQSERRVGSDIPTLFRRFLKVAAPYWSSEDKVQARLRLGALFALTLATTGISVGFSFLGRDFYNALANKDQEQFTRQLLYYLGGFAGGIPFFVLRDYSRETLSLRWRSWMTSYYMDRYLKNQTFYKIQAQSIIDNPDQRIVDDLSSFTGTSLAFSMTIFNAVIDLISFSNILYGIYPPLFIVLLVYSIGGTAISIFLGKGLIDLNFMQEKKEADFRYGLVRIRENAESIAFYGGEENEMQLMLQRFRRAFENLSELLIASRNLDFFTSGYRYLIQILPAAVVAPMYFSGKIEFGVINQSVSAFNHILSDFSLIVYQFQALSAFSAVIDRLGEFDDVLDGTHSFCQAESEANVDISLLNTNFQHEILQQHNGYMPLNERHKLLEIKMLTLETPGSRRTLISDLSLEINHQDHLLVMGPSGSGKTSLLRALAGLWNSGRGDILFYLEHNGKGQSLMSTDSGSLEVNSSLSKRAKGIFFLPQRPYMVLGSLREQLLYPTWTENLESSVKDNKPSGPLSFPRERSLEDVSKKPHKPTYEDLIQILERVRLGDILSRFNGLDTTCEWSSVLSLGEQQRLAFARLLLAKPTLVLLDESTSALDEENEGHLYQQVKDAGITYVSIGHRRTLYNYHNKVLHISNFSGKENEQNWHLQSITEGTPLESGKPA